MIVLHRDQITRKIKVSCSAEDSEELKQFGPVEKTEGGNYVVTVYDDVSFPGVCRLLLTWEEQTGN